VCDTFVTFDTGWALGQAEGRLEFRKRHFLFVRVSLPLGAQSLEGFGSGFRQPSSPTPAG